jgi:hypothetical protein
METENFEKLMSVFAAYGETLLGDLERVLSDWPTRFDEPHVRRVLGGLLCRQVNFSIHITSAPGLWNEQMAPLLLRPMLETHLKVAWILEDPITRSAGIAKADLIGAITKIQRLEESTREPGENDNSWLSENAKKQVALFERELSLFDPEKKPIMIESRQMAQKLGGRAQEYYRSYQVRFSSVVHSTWYHLLRFNLISDPNPLHRFQLIPMYPEIGFDFMPALAAADFCDKTFSSLNEVKVETINGPLENLLEDLKQIGAINRIEKS